MNLTNSNTQPFSGKSFYTVRLNDPKAVYLTKENFPVNADGIHDDSDAIQQAVNKVQEMNRFGIVFIPEGRYLLTKEILVWKGIRLIGYGANRPVFVLGENTPGYQDTEKFGYMVHFVSDKPEEGKPIREANPGTFYSAVSNINFEIKDGNQGAAAIRSHFAQHCYLAHIDFHIGSGVAGVHMVGNEIDDCRFFGGKFGIKTTKPSPSWPFLLIDSYFEGQREAAIETQEGGFTIIRNQFKNLPTAVSVNPRKAEELFMTDSRLENISGPAIIISDEDNARPQFNLKNIVCNNVPTLAFYRESGKQININDTIYQVKDFCHGQQIDDLGCVPEVKTTYDIEPLKSLPPLVESDIFELPDRNTWVNLASLGAKGDGITDDTEILKNAIDKYKTIYLPMGRYCVTDTITLKQDTVLIGLNPIMTQIMINDETPAFNTEGAPKPLIEVPKGGTNIITGIGLDTGGINKRAVAAKWMAGTKSMMNDVRFIGGHGTHYADGSNVPVYNENRNADGNPKRRWDSQYWSLWITDGGGGTFKDIWTPSPYAMAGIYISNTSTEGRIYAISIEHHVRHEVKIHNVSNWKIYDIQTEEERSESINALSIEIENSSNITFANLYLFTIGSQDCNFTNGVKIKNCKNLEFCGIHTYGPSKYSFYTTLHDENYKFDIRSREIARLKISGNPPKKLDNKKSPVLPSKAKVEKLAGGFHFIDGAALDSKGNVYFVDSRWNRIFRWSPATNDLTKILDIPISPIALAIDKSDNLMILCRKGWREITVYSYNPNERKEENLKIILPTQATSYENKTAILPSHRWRDYHDFLEVATSPSEYHYLSLDGSVYIPQSDDLTRTTSLRPAMPGKIFYQASVFCQKTYSFSVHQDGTLYSPKLFAEEGEVDTAVDAKGNVYIAAGQIFVYDKKGKQIDTIEVPERPSCLIFGGEDRQTLFITARTSLYSVQTRYGGQ